MQYITGIEAFGGKKKTAVTMGKFDGLHRGHQKLIERISEYESCGCESVVCAFDMNRESLMTKRERREHLEKKVDWLIEYPFTEQLKNMDAEDFVKNILHKRLNAAHIVIGSDFRFGHGKKGDSHLLEKLAPEYGYTLEVIEKERYKDRIISSTYIKEALSAGNVILAEKLLGYPYEITGIVEHGKQLGRRLGFPTMNIAPEPGKIVPRFGVYACRVTIDGKWYAGVGNAGIKPTVTNEKKRLIEVFIYDYEKDAYGKEISVQFCEFERPEMKFCSVQELKERVQMDMEYGRRYFSEKYFHRS